MFDFFWSNPVSRFLIILGLVLIVAGLIWPVLKKLGFGRLPGDIVVERDGLRIYFPVFTSILISVVITLILWLFHR